MIQPLMQVQLQPLAPQKHPLSDRLASLQPELQCRVYELLREPSPPALSAPSRSTLFTLFYINPHSRLNGLWNLTLILLIYLFEIQISFTLGFGPHFWEAQLQSRAQFVAYAILLLFLGVDIVLNFHRGYYAFGRGKIIDDPYLIIQHYLKIYFALDIAALAMLIIPVVHNGYFLNYLQLVPATILYMKKFKNQAEIVEQLQYHKKTRVTFTLLMLACDILLIGHFAACIFVGVDLLLWKLQYYGNDLQYYWLSNNSMYSVDLLDGSWVDQYIYAQSFSTGTLSTIAPGPFGKNVIEVAYSNFVMIFFMILASYAAEVLVSILLSEDEIRTFHEDNIQKFEKFMKLKGVSDKIKKRVHNFFELIWESEVKMSAQDENEVLDKLPVSLKEQLIIEMGFVKNLRLIRFFKNSDLLERLVSLKINSIVIDSDTTLFQAGTPPPGMEQRYLYHFKDGLAKFFVQHNEVEYTLALSNFQRNVGQFQFVTGLAYSYSCRSVDLCLLSRVANHDLLQIIRENNMWQEYQVLKYRLLVQCQLSLINKYCIVCQDQHTEDHCPQLNPSLKIQQRYQDQHKHESNQRCHYQRRRVRQGKERHIASRSVAKAHIVLLFRNYRGIGGLLTRLLQATVSSDRMENVATYGDFYPAFNVDNL